MVADALSTVDKTSLDANHSASPYALSSDAVVSNGSTTLAGQLDYWSRYLPAHQ